MRKDNSGKVKDNVILILWTILLAAFFSFLFYRQAIAYNSQYNSDLPAQIEAALSGDDSSVLALAIKGLHDLTGGFTYAIALFEGFIVAAAWAFASLYIEKIFCFKRWQAMLISLLLIHMTNIPAPAFGRFFAGSIIAQPWYNIAYNAMRLFAIPAMYCFAELYRSCRDTGKINWKYWIMACVLLFAATLMKSGFLMVLGAALVIFLLTELLTKKISPQNALLTLLIIVPAAVLLIIQYNGLRAADPGYRIIAGLSIFFFQEGKAAFFMKYATGLFFAIIVFVFNRKKMSKGLLFVYIAYAIALPEAMFLMESGPRQNERNFLWGMHIFALILNMNLIPVFLGNVQEYKKTGKKQNMLSLNFAYLAIGVLMIIAHALCGMQYYYYLMRGADYFI